MAPLENIHLFSKGHGDSPRERAERGGRAEGPDSTTTTTQQDRTDTQRKSRNTAVIPVKHRIHREAYTDIVKWEQTQREAGTNTGQAKRTATQEGGRVHKKLGLEGLRERQREKKREKGRARTNLTGV
jgi:hypothetical protein